MRESYFGRFGGCEPEYYKHTPEVAEDEENLGVKKNKRSVEDDVMEVLVVERDEFGLLEEEKDKAKEKHRMFKVDKALEAEEQIKEEEQPSLTEHKNVKEKAEEKTNTQRHPSGKASINFTSDYYLGNDGGRLAKMVDEEGNAIESGTVGGAVAEVELTKVEGTPLDTNQIGQKPIDSEGADDPSEIDPETSDEALERGGRELVERYLENIFRRFNGQIYRVGDINESALGHSVDFSAESADYVYGIPYSREEEMKALLAEGAKILPENSRAKFSRQTGTDIDSLSKNNLGFTRNIEVDGREYTVRFVLLQEQSGQDQAENDIL